MDNVAAATKRLNNAGASATYFPAEGMWLIFKGMRPIGDFHEDKIVAIDTYLASVKKEN